MSSDTNELDAYGHLNWTVGNEDWIACFDARRIGDEIEYHIVVNCETGGFIDTLEHDRVPVDQAIDKLGTLPEYWADVCSEHYINKCGRQFRVKYREVRRCTHDWLAHLADLTAYRWPAMGAGNPYEEAIEEPGPDPVRDGWIGSDGRP
jgi:hypothetical protein